MFSLKVVFMMQRIRVRLSSAQRADLWWRWKAGAVVTRDRAGLWQESCGHSLPVGASLTLAEREDISRGIAGGSSIRQIAKGLQRAVSTVSREVARHGGRPLYRANDADQQAWESAL
jgi:transposase, IS30 family